MSRAFADSAGLRATKYTLDLVAFDVVGIEKCRTANIRAVYPVRGAILNLFEVETTDYLCSEKLTYVVYVDRLLATSRGVPSTQGSA